MLQFSWVLRGRLAVGPAPSFVHHLNLLEERNIVSILCLCSHYEAPLPFGICERFHYLQCILPDHKSKRPPTPEEIQQACEALARLMPHGAVYVHCQAGVERSPLICMAWLMRTRHLSLIDALDYLKRVHPDSGPLPEQVASLRAWFQLVEGSLLPTSYNL
jgi:predicted protein tyrosine phosphatase